MSKYRVEMIVNGETVRKIRHNGRTYLPVCHGDEFQIRVYNHSGKRALAVVSVDGKSVIDGELANHDSPGYVINAGQLGTIDGWRQSDDVVATFRVGDKSESYSAKTGDGTKNTGVIGIVMYPEKPEPYAVIEEWVGGQRYTVYHDANGEEERRVSYRPTSSYRHRTDKTVQISAGDATRGIIEQCEAGARREEARLASCDFDGGVEREEYTSGGIVAPSVTKGGPSGQSVRSLSPRPRQVAGTEFGRDKVSHSRAVEFRRNLNAKEVITLYYDTAEGLRSRGIEVYTYDEPNPFPTQKFCRRP